ncbi:MAG: hypothetical protein FWD47_12610 [Treponema sp.]|nr:hypothetical protein [Treponema sp.]
MKKLLVIAVFFVLLSGCTRISNRNIEYMILEYRDIDKLNLLDEIYHELSKSEVQDYYDETYVRIYIDESYWKSIISILNKSNYRLENLLLPLGSSYRMRKPSYELKIKYKNKGEKYILIWAKGRGNTIFLNYEFYDMTEDNSKKLTFLLDGVIDEYKSNKL